MGGSKTILRCIEPPLEFLIGREASGHWLAVETHGLAGGIFSSASEALRFIESDAHGSARSIELVDQVLDPFDQPCMEIVNRHRARTSS